MHAASNSEGMRFETGGWGLLEPAHGAKVDSEERPHSHDHDAFGNEEVRYKDISTSTKTLFGVE